MRNFLLYGSRFSMTLLCLGFLSACSVKPIASGRKGLWEIENVAPASRVKNGSVDDADRFYGERQLIDADSFELPGEWRWPLDEVEISSSFGKRGRKFHQGIDLRAPIGTPVRAAQSGEVVYVGQRIRGYGKMVVLKHDGHFFSVYAHHSTNKVKLGDRVNRGEIIALSGRSGRASGAHLHFELRKGVQNFDPEFAIRNNLRKIASDAKSNEQNRPRSL